jgi:hypothetical protein
MATKSLESEFDEILKQAQEAFKKVAVGLQNDIVDGSPVDKGRFKTSWRIDDLNLDTFTFKMSNNVEYANKLWFGGNSKKGWGVLGGVPLIFKWHGILEDEFRKIK